MDKATSIDFSKRETLGNPSESGIKTSQRDRRLFWFLALLPVFLTFLAYLPSLSNGFVNWDDPDNIQNNLHIRSLDASSLGWMLSSFYQGFWFPLTLFSLALDYAIGSLNPGIYHLHSLLLHCLNTFLFFLFCSRFLTLARRASGLENRTDAGGWVVKSSFLAALFFGLSPVHVETVAWATDRKDVLCGFFYLGSLLVYVDYASSSKKWKLYACLGLFLLALMSKPMAVTLPLVFLLLDAWPFKRFGIKALLEKFPFLAASALVSWMALLAEKQVGAMPSVEEIPFIYRIANSLHSIFFHLWKMIVPVDLTALYPLAIHTEIASLRNLGLLILFLSISWLCFYGRKKWPFLSLAWLGYLVILAPVSGLLQVGGLAAADRYTYLTCLGPFILLASGIGALVSNRNKITVVGTVVLVFLMGMGTIRQAGTWKDSVSLWENVLKIYPGLSGAAYSNLALAYEGAGRGEEALRANDQALALNPRSAHFHDQKGFLLFYKGMTTEAIQEFKTAILLDPKQATAHRNLANAELKTGNPQDAEKDFETAVEIDPGLADAHNSLGALYLSRNQKDQALSELNQAQALEPENMKYLLDLAYVYQKYGKYDEAIDLFKRGIELNPGQGVYYLDLGIAYYLKGMYQEASEQLKKASELEPKNSDILRKLGLAYARLGKKDLAVETIRKAMALEAAKP